MDGTRGVSGGGSASSSLFVGESRKNNVSSGRITNPLDWLLRKDSENVSMNNIGINNRNAQVDNNLQKIFDENSNIKKIDDKARETDEVVSTLKNVNALMSKVLLDKENEALVDAIKRNNISNSAGSVEICKFDNPGVFLNGGCITNDKDRKSGSWHREFSSSESYFTKNKAANVEYIKYKNLKVYVIAGARGAELCVDYSPLEGGAVDLKEADTQWQELFDILKGQEDCENCKLILSNYEVFLPRKDAFNTNTRVLYSPAEGGRLMFEPRIAQFLQENKCSGLDQESFGELYRNATLTDGGHNGGVRGVEKNIYKKFLKIVINFINLIKI